MASDLTDSSEEPAAVDVLIVGAGIAGLAFASRLVKSGNSDLRILEARNRIGGRIVSITLGTQKIELGANWIHGVLGNPIYELALSNKLINITLDRKPHNVVATTEEGRRIPFVILEEIYEAYYYFLKRCEEYYLCHTTPPAPLKSVGDHLQTDINTYLSQFQGDELRLRDMVFDHLLCRETCITGCHSMRDIDLKEFGSYAELPGGNVQISQGFSSILECLTENVSPDLILKEHTVKKIRWKNNCGWTDHDQRAETAKMVEIECENGKRFRANHALITVPLGVLKEKAAHMFDPPLPDYKMESIGRLLFGTVNKIFLEYERPFLHPHISEVIILWAKMADISEDVPKNWYRKIYSFTKINETLLLTWVSGKEAIYAEAQSAEDIAETCTEILRKFLNDPYIPKPKRVIRTRWNSEVNTRGSYTSIGIGASQQDIENLAKPIYAFPEQAKPVLLFAGEATHPSFYSTTHGAFLSGRTAAELLIEPESPQEDQSTMEDLGELSSWIQGISLS